MGGNGILFEAKQDSCRFSVRDDSMHYFVARELWARVQGHRTIVEIRVSLKEESK